MQKAIIITGGAGFIGSHLCDRLVDQGYTVICVDNLLTGSQKNIAHLLSKKNFRFINQDVTKPFGPRQIPKISEIYHLASPADPNIHSPFSYMNHPFETMRVNSVGTWNMCELALKHRAKISFASTSEVYGNPEVSPQSEKYHGNVSSIGPRSVYDEAKRFGETIISAYMRKKGLNGRMTRIFNTYGPRMNPQEGRAVVNFINQAIRNNPITIYGDGKQTRSFCYVDDQVSGQIAAMDSRNSEGEVFNIGNPDERTILEFAKLIKDLSKSKSDIVFAQPLPEDDPIQRKPDISKANNVLGWKPKINLREGLIKTIDYFKKNYD